MSGSAKRVCSVGDCLSPSITRGWCHKHYKRWQIHGDPHYVKFVQHYGTPVERFWQKVDKVPSGLGCWLWTASKNAKGYGLLGAAREGKVSTAHVFSYSHFAGKIPEGLQVDHKYAHLGCPRHCVNPEHLRLVTNKQNQENRVAFYGASGYRGVKWVSRRKRWEARVIHNKIEIYVGSYKSYELHVAAYYARQARLSLYSHNEGDAG